MKTPSFPPKWSGNDGATIGRQATRRRSRSRGAAHRMCPARRSGHVLRWRGNRHVGSGEAGECGQTGAPVREWVFIPNFVRQRLTEIFVVLTADVDFLGVEADGSALTGSFKSRLAGRRLG